MNVKSTNIRSIDYDRTAMELTIVFKNRPRWTYVYLKVKPQTWVKFVQAESKGKFFADNIKDQHQFQLYR